MGFHVPLLAAVLVLPRRPRSASKYSAAGGLPAWNISLRDAIHKIAVDCTQKFFYAPALPHIFNNLPWRLTTNVDPVDAVRSSKGADFAALADPS